MARNQDTKLEPEMKHILALFKTASGTVSEAAFIAFSSTKHPAIPVQQNLSLIDASSIRK